MVRFTTLLVLLVGLMAGPDIALAELTLEVIELRHRSVEEILPVVEPLVGAGGSVSAFQGKLIVKTTPEQLDEIRDLLRTLDAPPRQLLISVTQDIDRLGHEQDVGVEGSIEAGDAEIGFPGDSAPRRGGAIGNVEARIGVESRRGAARRSDVQRVKVLDGHEATIHVGQSIPVVSRTTTYDGYPRTLESVEYRDALTGFVVLPRVTGDQVTLEIHPRQDVLTDRPGEVSVQHISSTVRGRLGEWISVGDITQRQAGESRSLASTRNFAESEQRGVWLKVEEVGRSP